MRLKDFQSQFKNKVLKDTATTVPVAERTLNTQERFYVYYNGLVGSLYSTLSDRYPRTRCLIGEDAFKEIAASYLHAHPPKMPYMALYGEDFPALAKSYIPAPVCQLMMLEYALHDSLLSYPSDIQPLAHLKSLDAQSMAQLEFSFCESVRFLESDYDLKQISLNSEKQEKFYLIRAKNLKAFFFELTKPQFVFVTTLYEGGTLGHAYVSATQSGLDFDLHPTLELLLQNGVISGASA
ncbi:MAG: DNA-binding domain-containing protein [Alphaproteobacteria bacterium]